MDLKKILIFPLAIILIIKKYTRQTNLKYILIFKYIFKLIFKMKPNEKYDLIIENLSNKYLSCDELINHLKENRFRTFDESKIFLDDLTDDLNFNFKVIFSQT